MMHAIPFWWFIISLSYFVFSCSSEEPESRIGSTEDVQDSGEENSDDASFELPSPSSPSTVPTSNQSPPPSGVGGVSTNPVSGCYKASTLVCKIENLISAKTNSYRVKSGVVPLSLDANDNFVARDWSKKQAGVQEISHDGFPDAREAVYSTEFKSDRRYYGENVAYNSFISSGNNEDILAEAVANYFAAAWYNSPGHKANMLRSSFKTIGVGIFQNSQGEWYATQLFR